MRFKMAALLALLNVMDVVLTYHVLSSGGTEAVLTSRWIINNLGFLELGIFKVGLSLLLVHSLYTWKYADISGRRIVHGLCVAMIAICAWNWIAMLVAL